MHDGKIMTAAIRLLRGSVCLGLVYALLGCETTEVHRRPGRRFAPRSELRTAAWKILDSEVFPKPTSRQRDFMKHQIEQLMAAGQYESRRVGRTGRISSCRAKCRALADLDRMAVPMLLRALDDKRPVGNLYMAFTLEQINPRIARSIWAELEKDERSVPCMKGRDLYTVPVAELAKGRGKMPAPRR